MGLVHSGSSCGRSSLGLMLLLLVENIIFEMQTALEKVKENTHNEVIISMVPSLP